MMNFLTRSLLFSGLFFQVIVFAKGQNDIYIQTRTDAKTINWLVKQVRHVMTSASSSGDPLDGEVKLENPIFLNFDELTTDESVTRIARTVAVLMGEKLENARLRIQIPNIHYTLESLVITPTQITVHDPILTLETQDQIRGVTVKMSQGITLDFLFVNPADQTVSKSVFTALIDQPTVIIPQAIPPLTLSCSVDATRDEAIRFKLKDYNLNETSAYFLKYQDQFIINAGPDQKPISIENIKINRFYSVFKPLLKKKLPQILSQVLKQVGVAMQENIGPHILNNIFSNTVTSSFKLANKSLYTRFSVQQFNQPSAEQLRFDLMGENCTATQFEQYREKCSDFEVSSTADAALPLEHIKLAQKEITKQLATESTNIAFSISQEYVNRVLKATIDAKLWDDMLTENSLTLGPKGAFVVFNKKTKTPELILDLYYHDRVQLHFPLRLSTLIELSDRTASDVGPVEPPHIGLAIDRVLSTPYEIIHGLPEYQIPSHLLFMFKRKIAAMILTMARQMNGQKIFEMMIPAFQDLGLENAWYETSPYGRLNFYFKALSSASLKK